jgi:DedD protein
MREPRRSSDRGPGRRERRHLVWLTLGGVVTLGLSFALGVLVGKRAARLEPAAPPADPIAQIDKNGDLHDTLTFYKKLTKPPAAQGAAAAAPAGAPSGSAAAAAASPSQPAESRRGPALEPPVSHAVASLRSAPSLVASPQAETGSAGASTADSALQAALRSGRARKGEYTVQVSSFQTAEEAKAYASLLERKGFRPFVVTGRVPGRGTWYRVRLGSFKDVESAQAAKTLLAHSDLPAWVLKTE